MAAGWAPDELPGQAFAALVRPLFEDAPGFIERLVAARPFGSWEALFSRGTLLALDMPEPEQRELIDAHPRIGAAPESVSALSFVEQGYDHDSAAESANRDATTGPAERDAAPGSADGDVGTELERLNRAYEARFGFRYVIFVAGRPRSAIVSLLEAALEADADAERERALRDVLTIGRDRAINTGLMAGTDEHREDVT